MATRDEILTILSRCWDEQASAEDFQRLNTLLKSDASARKYYVQLTSIDRRLRLRYNPRSRPALPPGGAAPRRRRIDATPDAIAITSVPDSDITPSYANWIDRLTTDSGGRLILSLAASAAVIAVMLFTLNFVSVRPHEAQRAHRTTPISSARILAVHDCQWGSEQTWKVKDRLEPGAELELVRGLVEIRHASGANLIVEGPALVQILGPNEAKLTRGQLTAHVPPMATGYRVQTNSAEIEDLGTEFGLLVKPSGDLEVHVLLGRVQTHFHDAAGVRQTIPLNNTQGLRLSAESRTSTAIPPNADAFVRSMPTTTDHDSPLAQHQLLALIEPGAEAWALVPQDASTAKPLEDQWYLADFVVDAAWHHGATGVGYDTQNKEIADLVKLSVAEMFEQHTSVWVRIPFELNTPVPQIERLVMAMQLDDGFVAYLNGEKVAEFNAPQAPQFDSVALAARPEAQEMEGIEFDLTAHVTKLKPGRNWLAIHGLNHAATSTDLLVLPRLDAWFTPPAAIRE